MPTITDLHKVYLRQLELVLAESDLLLQKEGGLDGELKTSGSLCEQFLRVSDSEQLLEFFWRHAAPETAPVLDTLGRHLSDPKLAKAARKAAMRHRSWLANEQPG